MAACHRIEILSVDLFSSWINIKNLRTSRIQVISFLIYGLDKQKARKHQYRISEKTLFLVAVFGGGAGAFIGMYFFHHKTKHWYFVIGIPVIMILWAVGLIYVHMNVL